jgi:ubiquinone/menaquinone biosynthesis C-methylase UbiE
VIAVTRRSWLWLTVALALPAAFPWAQGGRDEWQQPDRVIADLALRPGLTVADVGCGHGYFTFRLAPALGETGHVFALDIDRDAIAEVAARAKREHRDNVEALVSDPTDTKLPADSLDAALLCLVLHEASPADRAPLVRSIARALKPGACLYLIDWRQSHDVTFDPYEKLIPRDDLLKLATDAGLTLDAEYHYLRLQVFFRLRKPVTP